MSARNIAVIGDEGCGKSSIVSVVLAGADPRDTRKTPSHRNTLHCRSFPLLNDVVFNTFECDSVTLLDSHLPLDALVFVFSVEQATREQATREQATRELDTFEQTAKSIRERSPDCRIYFLFHKADLASFRTSEPSRRVSDAVTFVTSIWDSSLYRVWSTIVSDLLGSQMAPSLDALAVELAADELLILDWSTCLLIQRSGSSPVGDFDPERFEKLSNILRQYRGSCATLNTQMASLLVADQTRPLRIIIEEVQTRMWAVLVTRSVTLSNQAIRQRLHAQLTSCFEK